MSVESGPQFLKEEYGLHNKPEVEAAVKRSEQQTGERVPDKANARIQVFLDRLEHVFDPPALEGHEGFDRTERNLALMKQVLHDRYVIKPEDVPERAFLLEQQAVRELGYGDVEITDEFRIKKTAEIIGDQTASLDRWLDYLTSDDADYPVWAKYWAFRSMLSLGKLIKKDGEEGDETASFQKRTKDTIAPFPVINPRALALSIGAVSASREQRGLPKTDRVPVPNMSDRLSDEEWHQLVATENFAKLYTQFLIEQPEYSSEGLQNIRGKWVIFPQGSDPETYVPKDFDQALVPSITNHPLEWCTANPDTARGQLQGGDFYVYYSENEQGEAVIPRAAIKMIGDSIAEVRGIAAGQQIDPYIAPVIQSKMAEFPDGAAYEKKAADMRQLTTVEHRMKAGQNLSRDDLIFLYEIDGSIEGFAINNAKDPRIAELRAQRDPEADAPIVFECTPEQIAHNTSEITADTKAYIGKLEPGIFDLIQQNSIDHVFTTFPEGKISRVEVRIGGKTAQELQTDLNEVCRRANGEVNISPYAQDMLNKIYQMPEFIKLVQNPEQIQTVRLKVSDLGFESAATTDQIYARAAEMGLELCQPEVGPYQRLQDTDQPLGEWYRIAMKQIGVRDGVPGVFRLGRGVVGLWLSDYWAGPAGKWGPGNQFVFRLRKPSLDA